MVGHCVELNGMMSGACVGVMAVVRAEGERVATVVTSVGVWTTGEAAG